ARHQPRLSKPHLVHKAVCIARDRFWLCSSRIWLRSLSVWPPLFLVRAGRSALYQDLLLRLSGRLRLGAPPLAIAAGSCWLGFALGFLRKELHQPRLALGEPALEEWMCQSSR